MENKKKNIVLCVIIGILIVLLLLLGGYIIYDKSLNSTNNNVINSDTSNIQNDLINDKYRILNDSNGNDVNYDDNNYLIKLNSKNSYDVVYEFGDHFEYIGVYDNKIYYSTSVQSSEGYEVYIKYISLDSDTFNETIWLEIPQPNCFPDSIGCASNELGSSIIINDTLYFNFNSFSGGSSEYDGLMSLNMNAKNFDEYKNIEKHTAAMYGWCINKNNIYYIEDYKKLVEQNITSNTKKILLEFGNEASFNYLVCDNEKILYNSFVSTLYNENTRSHHELYLYNTNNNNNTLITDKIYENFGGGIHSIANIINGKIYYRIGNKIYLYNENDKSDNVFYTTNNSFGEVYQFFFINENIMKIRYKGMKVQYVINGQEVSSIDTINVKMNDGTIKTYTIDYLK